MTATAMEEAGCEVILLVQRGPPPSCLNLAPRWLHPMAVARCVNTDWSRSPDRDVERHVEESLVLPMKHPATCKRSPEHARRTPTTGALHRGYCPSTSMLFHGPPGTGKTTAARLAAQEAELLVYAPPRLSSASGRPR